ncbi:MAG: hypothetical protein ACOCWC_04915 [Bacteroidota bacterium]
MKEQLITLKTAMLAHDKGFNTLTPTLSGLEYDNKGFCGGAEIVTQSLLQKWLREEHELHITIDYHKSVKYSCRISDEVDQSLSYDLFGEVFPTYEDALEAGLQKALKLINP